MCSPFTVIIPFYICDICVWTSLGPWKSGRGSLPGMGRGMWSPLVSRGFWEPGGVWQIQHTWESEQGRAHLTSPPDPWAALQGGPSNAAHTPPGKQTHLRDLFWPFLNSSHRCQMSWVMLFQSLGVQSDPDHLGACYAPQSPPPVPAVLAGPSVTPVPCRESLTSRLSEGTEGRVSGAGAQDPSSLSWDSREV